VLNHALLKGSWTLGEDETILSHVADHGQKDWNIAAELLPGRLAKQIREG
jgi:hypothetical protein